MKKSKSRNDKIELTSIVIEYFESDTKKEENEEYFEVDIKEEYGMVKRRMI